MKFILLSFLFFHIQSAYGNQCPDLFEWKRSSLFLPGKTQRLLLGVVIEREPQQGPPFVLAVDDYYFSDHRTIYRTVLSSVPTKKIIWTGELLLENRESEPREGTIVASINTSGFAWNSFLSFMDNDPKDLAKVLAKYAPHLVSKNTQHLSYSDDYSHLDPFLREFRGCESSCEERWPARHQLQNLLQAIFIFFDPQSFPKEFLWEQELTQLQGLIDKKMIDNVILFWGSLVRYGSGAIPKGDLERAIVYLKKFMHGEIKSEVEFRSLIAAINKVAVAVGAIANSSGPELIVLSPDASGL